MTSDYNPLAELDSLEIREYEFSYGGVDYILREADGATSVWWEDAKAECRIFNSEGKFTGFKKTGELEPGLVSKMLFKVDGDKETPVSIKTVKEFPARVLDKLFKVAKDISDFSIPADIQVTLLKALALPDSPVSLKELTDWAMTLEGKEYESVRDFFRPTAEELAKNVLVDTANGSN